MRLNFFTNPSVLFVTKGLFTLGQNNVEIRAHYHSAFRAIRIVSRISKTTVGQSRYGMSRRKKIYSFFFIGRCSVHNAHPPAPSLPSHLDEPLARQTCTIINSDVHYLFAGALNVRLSLSLRYGVVASVADGQNGLQHIAFQSFDFVTRRIAKEMI